MTPDPIARFLARLEQASAALPAEVRADLLEDITAHLDEVRREARAEVDVHAALDRLGRPEEIVAAAARETGTPPPPADLPPPATEAGHGPSEAVAGGVRPRDVVAIGLVVFGAVVGWALLFLVVQPLMPIGAIGAYLTGIVLLWSSRAWTPGEKLLATLVWPGGIATPLFLALLPTGMCTTVADPSGGPVTTCTGFTLPPLVGIPLFVAVTSAPVIVGGILLMRAHRRALATGVPGPRSRAAG